MISTGINKLKEKGRVWRKVRDIEKGEIEETRDR